MSTQLPSSTGANGGGVLAPFVAAALILVLAIVMGWLIYKGAKELRRWKPREWLERWTSARIGAMTLHNSSEIVQIVASAFQSGRSFRGRPIPHLLAPRLSSLESTAAEAVLR